MTTQAPYITRRALTAGTQDTTQLLRHAALQARSRKFSEILIVDADAHHYETESWPDIVARIEDPVIRRQASGASTLRDTTSILPGTTSNDIELSGRIPRYGNRVREMGNESEPRDVTLIRRSMTAMGIDYTVLFPGPLLRLGFHPSPEYEVQVARAYARWLTEVILPADKHIKTMLYLPFQDPLACLRLVQEFGDRSGVIGFLVACYRDRSVDDNAYMPLYAELERRRFPIAFHSSVEWTERHFAVMNRYLSIHALGMPFNHMVHMTNWVINGLPERFPGLRTIWIEGGLAFVPFLMQRLDSVYMMRSSEAPLLRKMPSDYMRVLFYTSQPLEVPLHNLDVLKTTFQMINAETQLLYASDYPHWDFDLPSQIYDLPFLSESQKLRILGQNAASLFRLDETVS